MNIVKLKVASLLTKKSRMFFKIMFLGLVVLPVDVMAFFSFIFFDHCNKYPEALVEFYCIGAVIIFGTSCKYVYRYWKDENELKNYYFNGVAVAAVFTAAVISVGIVAAIIRTIAN